jgi:NADH-quinone oxidoreductase subunit G
VEVPAGTNLIEAGLEVGVQIPHYCYHPRLSVVGQCRMCLVEVEVGGRKMPKLQAGCSTQVEKDGMVVRTTTPEVREAQRAMMEFLLINHPLDCPICDQAGECALQDYAFKHGQAYSRFRFEDKRTYPGRERIPLGANVLLNMNRCIQCTRCVRFTHEVSKTGELGFFNRGARAEIGTFPGKELDNPLATCVVDICPVGALTSTRFRFAERVFYLDKKPSLCTGCEVGCNITIEHRRGDIKRYKPRYNPEVNDYWMCDYGRATFERYKTVPRLKSPRLRGEGGVHVPLGWKEALDLAWRKLRARGGEGAVAFLGSGFLTTEEAYLFARLADRAGTPHRSVAVDMGPEWRIPNLKGGIAGREAAPNRRGAEIAGLGGAWLEEETTTSAAAEGPLADAGSPVIPSAARDLGGGDLAPAPRPDPSLSLGMTGSGNGGADRETFGARELLESDAASRCSVLVVCDTDFSAAAHDPETVARLRRARFLIAFGWADTALAQAADLSLPLATHAEKDGTFVNVEHRLQRFRAAFPPPGQVRTGVEVLTDLLARYEPGWAGLGTGAVFDRMARELPGFAGLSFDRLPATGVELPVPGAGPHGAPAPVGPLIRSTTPEEGLAG